MSYTPALPLSGIAGWQFLQRTEASQRAAFAEGTQEKRELAYFRDNIAKADTVEKLLEDHTLLKVTLTAFGLEDEQYKKAWIRKVLEEGTESEEAFANRLSDPRWREFSKALGFGNLTGARTGFDSFREDIAARYLAHGFEVAVGEIDEAMRLALNFRDHIGERVDPAQTDLTNWYRILGDKPLREVLDTALGLPREFAQLDVAKQAATYAEKLQSRFKIASPAELLDPAKTEEIIRDFLVRTEIENGPSPTAPGMAALQLLQSGPLGLSSAGIASLILSNG